MSHPVGNPGTADGDPVLDDLDDDDGRELIGCALAAIARALNGGAPLKATPEGNTASARPRLARHGACFVSLHRGPSLLGCIGTLAAHRPLYVDAAANGVAAAFADPRLPGIDGDDFESMSVEVSVLGTPMGLDVSSMEELLGVVRPGVDGLVVRHRTRRATLLPSVWERIPDAGDFIDVLWRKAGLPARRWPRGVTVEHYRTRSFEDPGPRLLPPAGD